MSAIIIILLYKYSVDIYGVQVSLQVIGKAACWDRSHPKHLNLGCSQFVKVICRSLTWQIVGAIGHRGQRTCANGFTSDTLCARRAAASSMRFCCYVGCHSHAKVAATHRQQNVHDLPKSALNATSGHVLSVSQIYSQTLSIITH